MIPIAELKTRARKENIQERTIEIDFVLGWLLLCLGEVPALSRDLVFKGGTALRKIYSSTWRYSEDLDFTLSRSVSRSELIAACATWCERTARASGLTLGSPEEDTPAPAKLAQQGNFAIWLPFVGPLGKSARHRRIKVDISATEPILLPPEQRAVTADFSDQHRIKRKVQVYAAEEILAEKLRSLLQRREPRDLYDTWRLLTSGEVSLDIDLAIQLLPGKCQTRAVRSSDLRRILTESSSGPLARAWQIRLGSQLSELPDLALVIREVKRHLRHIL